MMRPPLPWAIICLAASWVPKKALFRLISMTFSYCASVVSRTEVRVSMPALLTMTSSRPSSFTVRSIEHLEVRDLAHVRIDPDRLVAKGGDLFLKVLSGLLVGHVIDHDVGAGTGQGQRDGFSDPGVATGDDGDLPFERHRPLLSSRVVASAGGGRALLRRIINSRWPGRHPIRGIWRGRAGDRFAGGGAVTAVDQRLLKMWSSNAGSTWHVSVLLGTLEGLLLVAQAWLLATIIAGAFVGGKDLADLRRPIELLLAVFLVRALVSWAPELAANRCSAQVKSHAACGAGPPGRPTRAGRSSTGRTGDLATLAIRGIDALDGYFARYLPQVVLAVIVPSDRSGGRVRRRLDLGGRSCW